MKATRIFLLSIFLTALPVLLFAQNEIERENLSLEGLQQIGFTANLEGSRTVTSDTSLTPSSIRQQAVNQLVQAELQYVSDEEVRSSTDIPFLHMHINMLEMENGLVPFSIELRFYQPVKLILNRDLQTSASTWETGMVGLVSLDRLPVIGEAAGNLVSEFIDDFHQSNQTRRVIR
ncbi:MAG: hypothetical protein WEA56_16805 [Balneolaceae bacterium]